MVRAKLVQLWHLDLKKVEVHRKSISLLNCVGKN